MWPLKGYLLRTYLWIESRTWITRLCASLGKMNNINDAYLYRNENSGWIFSRIMLCVFALFCHILSDNYVLFNTFSRLRVNHCLPVAMSHIFEIPWREIIDTIQMFTSKLEIIGIQDVTWISTQTFVIYLTSIYMIQNTFRSCQCILLCLLFNRLYYLIYRKDIVLL